MTMTTGVSEALVERIERVVRSGVAEQIYPGTVWAVGDVHGVQVTGACGHRDASGAGRAMTDDVVFDLASLTKIVATWGAVGCLVEDGRLGLDDTLDAHWPDLRDRPLGRVSVRHLLTHTAGLPLRANLRPLYGPRREAIEHGVLHDALRRAPGEAVEYTDRAALILGFLVERLTGTLLGHYCRDRLWEPLGMHDTRFGPLSAEQRARCAPTEYDAEHGSHLQGYVHDFSARALGSSCGAAGVFSTAADLGRFLRYVLAPTAVPDGSPGFGQNWVRESLRIHTGRLRPDWGLLWFPPFNTTPEHGLWVHYGFTGTGMWLRPTDGLWAVLLTNKVYFSRDREPIMRIRDAFQALVFGR
ncbi:esterase [Streptomyces albiflavescens]|uniref:Esterase n=1 Tax=Streptomyces albiflavescens TaxID=1623582 RepID=A0A917Y6A1_9ACTN|nr:serine hydrolase domain-containing protein [Streptomyces albiflavescens]GGN71989.1 esterase [Streptomyces albiflavescens]